MPDVYSPINAQVSVKAAQEILADFITDLNGRANVELWLYQNNVTPQPTNTLAAYVEATFSAYTRFAIASWSAVAWTRNITLTPHRPSRISCARAGVNNTIYGSILVGTNVAGTQAVATNAGNAGAYASSFTLSNAGAGYTAIPKVSLTGATGSGATAHAVLNANGTLASIVLDSGGSGYTTYTW